VPRWTHDLWNSSVWLNHMGTNIKNDYSSRFLMVDDKNKKKPSSNKITIKILVQGKKVPVTGTISQIASLVNKLISEKKPTIENTLDMPPPELVFDHIIKQKDYEHSIRSLMEFFFGKNEKSAYPKMYKMAKDVRKHIIKKYGGEFRKDLVPTDYSKRPPTKSIVWSFEPTTSRD